MGDQLGNKFRYCRLSQPTEKMGMSIVARKTEIRVGGPVDGLLDLVLASCDYRLCLQIVITEVAIGCRQQPAARVLETDVGSLLPIAQIR